MSTSNAGPKISLITSPANIPFQVWLDMKASQLSGLGTAFDIGVVEARVWLQILSSVAVNLIEPRDIGIMNLGFTKYTKLFH